MKPHRWTSRCTVAIHLALGLLLLHGSAGAQSTERPPDVLSFQGRLIGGDGGPLGGDAPVNYKAVFRLLDSPTGGKTLWAEQQTITVSQGRFSVLMGEGEAYQNESRPALSSIFVGPTASDRYVEVAIKGPGTQDGWATISPRTRLAAGAYTFLASHSRSAGGLVSSTGQPVVTTDGNKVGINKANPTAALDVGGTLAAKSFSTPGTVQVANNTRANAFYGRGMAPVGSIVMWSGATPPEGWVLCDGSVANGVQTPDLRGRFVPAAGWVAGRDPIPMRIPLGSETYTHRVTELPAHSHFVQLTGSVGNYKENSHSYRYPRGGGGQAMNRGNEWTGPREWLYSNRSTTFGGDHSHVVDLPPFQSGTSGGGAARNAMPPFYVLTFIMRVQ